MDRIIIDGLAFSLPLFIMAVGGIYSEKSGITNLALEGLQGFGAFIGAFIAILVAGNFAAGSQMPFVIALVAAIIGGGLYALLHALLCIKFKANQVVSGVVINILAIALTVFLTKQINLSMFGSASNKFTLQVAEKIDIPFLSEIPFLGSFFSELYLFEIIIVFVAFFAWYLMYKTRFGMNLRACGDNPHAVDAAGVSVAKIRLIAIIISGSLSGIAGISYAFSISASFSPSIFVGYGYLAIAAFIFGNWSILFTFFTCLFFGFARSTGSFIVQLLELPSAYQDLIAILPYVLTLVLLVFFSKSNRMPRALGEIYDKGKR